MNIGSIHQVHFQDGKECTAIKELYNLLKDHRNPYIQDLVTTSYQQSYQEEVSSLLGGFEMFTQELDECGTENVLRVTLINQGFQQSFMNAIGKMTKARLQIDNFGFNVLLDASKNIYDKLTICNMPATEAKFTKGMQGRSTPTCTSVKQCERLNQGSYET